MTGPVVSLKFEGDERDLVQSFDKAGDAADDFGDQVGKTSRDIRSHTGAFDNMAEKTDESEKKFTGFKDVLDGATSGLAAWNDESLSGTDKMIALGQSAADIAGGLTDFLIPAISSMTTLMRGGLAQAMTFISSHPLLITLGLLAAAFVLLWTNSETFRNVVIGVFKAVGGFISDVFGGVIHGIIVAWEGVIGFFGSIPGRIGAAFASLGSMIANVFKGAVNGVVQAINWFVDHTLNWLIDRANDVIRWIPGVPYIPRIGHIPTMHTGARVPGGPGTTHLALLQAGEVVNTETESNRGGIELYVSGNPSSWMYQAIKEGLRAGQLVLRRA